MGSKKNGKKVPIGDAIPDFLRDAVLARYDDPQTMERWPKLYAGLNPVYEGATLRRQAGRITFKIIGPNLIVTLSNPSEIIDIDFVVSSLTTAFDEVETALASGAFHTKPSWQKNRKKLPTILDDAV